MYKYFIKWAPLYCFLIFFSCSSTKNINGQRSAIKSFKTLLLDQNHFSGIIIKDLSSGDIIISKNENLIFTPASNTKLLTFYITDQILPDSVPTIHYCLQNDTLFFSGLGDPTFLHPDFEQQKAFDFLKESNHPLILSSGIKVNERFGSGWAWDDYPYYFQQEKSWFPVYGNSLWIKKDSTDKSYTITPPSLKRNIGVVRKTGSGFKVTRKETTNHFQITYDTLPAKIGKTIPLRMSDSLLIDLLSDSLGQEIFFVNKQIDCQYSTIYSYPKDSLYKKLLEESDNFIAEQLLISAGVYLSDTLTGERLIDYAMTHHFSSWKDNINWVDGSGLSRYNMLTPEFLINLLERIYRENNWDRIKLVFPEGGKEGTLKNIFEEGSPFVYAKSGSMTGVYNLSGYLITDNGNKLAFSIMNNNFNTPFNSLKREIENYLLFIKREY